jgi:two-component system, OmpR family, response regulator
MRSPVGTLSRTEPRRHAPSRVLEASLETSQLTGERLMKALQRGAGDFVLSSSDGQLTARVRLTLQDTGTTVHELGGRALVVDWSRATVALEKDQVSLSRTELRLLAALIEGAGRAVTRSQLIARVWPDDRLALPDRENALAVYVWSLRKRLAAIGAASALVTVRGAGYRIDVERRESKRVAAGTRR